MFIFGFIVGILFSAGFGVLIYAGLERKDHKTG